MLNRIFRVGRKNHTSGCRFSSFFFFFLRSWTVKCCLRCGSVVICIDNARSGRRSLQIVRTKERNCQRMLFVDPSSGSRWFSFLFAVRGGWMWTSYFFISFFFAFLFASWYCLIHKRLHGRKIKTRWLLNSSRRVRGGGERDARLAFSSLENSGEGQTGSLFPTRGVASFQD